VTDPTTEWRALAGGRGGRAALRSVTRLHGNLRSLIDRSSELLSEGHGADESALSEEARTALLRLKALYVGKWNAVVRVRRHLLAVARGEDPAPPRRTAAVRELARDLARQTCSCEHRRGHRCVEQRAMRAAATLLGTEPRRPRLRRRTTETADDRTRPMVLQQR
jgi:hypothetical protein